MKISVTVTKEVEELPACCSKCPLADVCDSFLSGITKNHGMEWSKAATTRRIKACPMKIEEE